jgi:hypothetical protein
MKFLKSKRGSNPIFSVDKQEVIGLCAVFLIIRDGKRQESTAFLLYNYAFL